MITIITRWTWIIVTLVALAGVVFIVLYEHTANEVQAAANAASQVAAISANSNALQQAVTNNLKTNLPAQVNGQTLFDPATDITTTAINNNQDVVVSVTYHMPVLGPMQALFSFGSTISITRTTTQALDYPHNGLNAVISTSSPAAVEIQNVALNSSGNHLTLTVNGDGFGFAPPGVPGTEMGSFFSFHDLTQGWQAGSTLSGLAVTYSSWNNQQVVVTGIQNYGKGTETIQSGDNCQITVASTNGSTTYSFVANPSGTTQYSATLAASATNVPETTPVTFIASTSVAGNGTNGIGIYDEVTGQYLDWSGSGTTLSQLVNSGTAAAQDYVAYYGPQGQISQAIAVSDNIGVTWTGENAQNITAVMYQNGSSYYVDVYGTNLTGAIISGAGLSTSSQVSNNEVQINASNASDTNGEVMLANGTQIPFTATSTY